jgi:hypothetical protein
VAEVDGTVVGCAWLHGAERVPACGSFDRGGFACRCRLLLWERSVNDTGTTTLWRPTGPEELALVVASGWRELLDRREVHRVGGDTILEYWIPAGELEEFDANIAGLIAVVSEFR